MIDINSKGLGEARWSALHHTHNGSTIGEKRFSKPFVANPYKQNISTISAFFPFNSRSTGWPALVFIQWKWCMDTPLSNNHSKKEGWLSSSSWKLGEKLIAARARSNDRSIQPVNAATASDQLRNNVVTFSRLTTDVCCTLHNNLLFFSWIGYFFFLVQKYIGKLV